MTGDAASRLNLQHALRRDATSRAHALYRLRRASKRTCKRGLSASCICSFGCRVFGHGEASVVVTTQSYSAQLEITSENCNASYNRCLYASQMSEIHKRIAQARLHRGLNQSELARALAVTPQSVQAWESGKNIPRSPKLRAIASVLGVSLGYLMGEEEFLPAPSLAAEASMLGPISAWDDNTELDDDEVAIPLLKDVRVAAGTGRIAEDFDSGKKIRMGKVTLRNQGVQFDKAVCVTVHGNSMEPALPEGSTVGVNLGNTTVKDGKVYVIKHDGELRVKQLYRLPGDGLRLRSFNRVEHDDEDYTAQELIDKDISVVGKIFWSSVLWD